jgi:hypothetical protein
VRPKYAVFLDRPYYPSVSDLFDTLDEAIKHAESTIKDQADEDGEHESTVYVAKVVTVSKFKTSH